MTVIAIMSMPVDMIVVLFAPSVRTRSCIRESMRLDLEPALHLEGLALDVEQIMPEKVQGREVLLGGQQERRRGVQAPQSIHQAVDLSARPEIGLGHDQPIGHGGLLARFRLPLQLRQSIDRVDRRDDETEAIMVTQNRFR